MIPRDTPEPITDPAQLEILVEHVRERGAFAFDTEFIGEESYDPYLCLIQIATTDEVALVDPLGLDVTPVWELVADPDLETIVHAGDQDLEPVVRNLERAPANIFDTQIAAGFTGRPYPLGLRRLVFEFMNVRLGKALTFTRWDDRPLSKVHTRYAADDVRYLPAVRAALGERLAELGHEAWVREECASLTNVERYHFDPDARLTRLLSNHSMKPRGVSVLRELIVLRDEAARAEDTPPRTLLRDEVLLRLARDPIKKIERLPAVKGLPRPVVERYGTAIMEATARGLETRAPERLLAATPEETSLDRAAIDGLWSLACAYCRGRGVDPGLVGSRRLIAQSYFAARSGAAHPTSGWAKGWRAEFVGDVLDDLLGGRRGVSFSWTDDRLDARVDPTDAPA
jgi:ribonuclease D